MTDFLNNFFMAIWPQLRDWLLAEGLTVVLIIVGAFIVNRILGVVVIKVIRKVLVPDMFTTLQAEEKRENTLIRILTGTLRLLVWLVALAMVLSEFGINTGPLIAGAGVAGVAIGFGGQYLIRDVITGLFLILENQFRVGDVVKIGQVAGVVEDITLRKTVLRDLDGTVHHIPNGEIATLANLSKDFSRVNIDIGVSYNADLEKVEKVVNRVGQSLADDPNWGDKIIDAPKFVRVNDFADSAVMIKILGDVRPLDQWDVAGEFKKRLKIAFDKEGIEIPFPQRVIHQAK